MGEIFHRSQPAVPLAWTGERLVSDLHGQIECEHLHRYFLAREFCRGKRVLDVASGEGYGSALLAQTAYEVTGVEIDAAAVEHASQAYKLPNLRFIQGEAAQLPLAAESVDVVVSFETLEHFFDQERFVAEVRRVLHPDGMLIVSTPDSDVYSNSESAPNPFHVRELTKAEFSDLLKKSFRNVSLFQQRFFEGSAVLPESAAPAGSANWIYERRSPEIFEAHRYLARAPYLIAVASDASTPALAVSLFLQSAAASPAGPQDELERLRKVEAAAREQAPIISQKLAEGAAAQQEAARLLGNIQQVNAVAAAAREEGARLATLLTQANADLARAAEAAQAASGRESAHNRELSEAQETIRKLEVSALLARQQAPLVLRLQRELGSIRGQVALLQDELEIGRHRLQTANEEIDRLRQLSDQLSRLILPVWMRKLLPPGIRPAARAFKRLIRPQKSVQ